MLITQGSRARRPWSSTLPKHAQWMLDVVCYNYCPGHLAVGSAGCTADALRLCEKASRPHGQPLTSQLISGELPSAMVLAHVNALWMWLPVVNAMRHDCCLCTWPCAAAVALPCKQAACCTVRHNRDSGLAENPQLLKVCRANVTPMKGPWVTAQGSHLYAAASNFLTPLISRTLRAPTRQRIPTQIIPRLQTCPAVRWCRPATSETCHSLALPGTKVLASARTRVNTLATQCTQAGMGDNHTYISTHKVLGKTHRCNPDTWAANGAQSSVVYVPFRSSWVLSYHTHHPEKATQQPSQSSTAKTWTCPDKTVAPHHPDTTQLRAQPVK